MILEKVFNCIKANPMCSVAKIADSTKMKEIDVLHAINELVERGFVKITPVPLSVTNDDSARYSTIQEVFIDDFAKNFAKKW